MEGAERLTGDYKLSSVLTGHTSDVRAVLLPDPSFAITASRDGTTRVWKQTSTSPPAYDPTESSNGAQFKTCLAYVTPSDKIPAGLIISSGQDGIIEARQTDKPAGANADGFMVGHGNQVCSLDVNAQAGWIVSGSWDKTARIWYIGRWEPEVELEGHTGAVWAVIAYSDDKIVTGCADRGIRVFDVLGKLYNAFDGQDIVRALVKLPAGHNTGGDIASASNDGVIRIWNLGGKQIGELHGHESFIYSLAVLPTGEIVSSGEDRTVRIWERSTCIQVITLPAISVWSVSACRNGDIITGSSDKVARIFTRSRLRLADPVTVAQFDDEVKSSAIPQQQVGPINRTDLPGPDFLEQKAGTKEGQSQMIKELDGSTTLYQWSISQQTWVKIGEVVDSAGSSGNKQSYNGKEYDYVFDIDIADGQPPLKLPFNVIQNPYDAATKFLQDNELPISYLEETANFIIKNTQGASLGPSQPAGPDAWGTEARYRPGDVPTSAYVQPPRSIPKQTLPQKEYLSIIIGKPAATFRHIAKLNSEFNTSGRTDSSLSVEELDSMTKLFEQLEGYNFHGKPSLIFTPALGQSMPAALKIGTEWQPPSSRLAGLDLLRFLAAAAKEFSAFDPTGSDPIAMIVASGVFEPETLQQSPKLAMISIRFFSNLLYGSASGRAMVGKHCDVILENLKKVTKIAASDVLTAVALTTFYLNLAVFLTSDGHLESSSSADRGLTVMEELVSLLSSFPAVDHRSTAVPLGQTTEPAYRGIIALGTVIVGLKRDEVAIAAKEVFDVPELLDKLKDKKFLAEPRFRSAVSEIRAALV